MYVQEKILLGPISYPVLSYDVVSGSDIMPCIKIDKPLVVFQIFG